MYVRSLHFEHEPDYGFITTKLKSIADKEMLKIDNEYDWTVKSKKPVEPQVQPTTT